MAQQPLHTDAEGLTAGEVNVPVVDGEMLAYRAQPAVGGAPPVVLVVQEIFGVHEYIRDVCRRLAKLGYLAIAPELYARQGDPRKLGDIDTLIANIVSKVPDAQVLADLDACVTWAARSGGDAENLAITGFCWGGRMVWMYCAHKPQVKAGVAWYGRLLGQSNTLTPLHPLDIAASLSVPVLGLYGAADASIPVTAVEAMQQALKAGTSGSQIIVYPDAAHAFHADYRPSFRKAAAEDGWVQLQNWFAKHGV